ncbi:hypothetical protein PN36_17610 [Candidatus Thiomargarita nelsonii]|uniref:Uncharacterized protein n=1 Tax=Candidatus Thiomargarita nelsonii TaxID=1003181 RepID=A0A0A6P8K5_9GAMM|nr:hypothetical protein PN36_17610 [Candidatus Thiomargarita nelsonii]
MSDYRIYVQARQQSLAPKTLDSRVLLILINLSRQLVGVKIVRRIYCYFYENHSKTRFEPFLLETSI